MSKKDSILNINQDSILQLKNYNTNDVSIFTDHGLKVIHNAPVFNTNYNYYWPSIILFIALSIYVLVRISEPKKILKIFISVFSFKESKQSYREDFKLTKRLSFLLLVGFVLVVSFLIYLTNNYYGKILQKQSSLNQFLFFAAIIICVYCIKFLTNYVVAFISSNNDLGKEYTYTILAFCQTTGIILFPLVVCIQFTRYPVQWFLFPVLLVLAILYSLRLIKSLIVYSAQQNIGIVYIILYLCALEILPLLVLIKFLLINF